jgi:hypothetical protein
MGHDFACILDEMAGYAPAVFFTSVLGFTSRTDSAGYTYDQTEDKDAEDAIWLCA